MEGQTASLVRQINEGILDIAVLAAEADLGSLAHEPIVRDEFVLAASTGHPLVTPQAPAELSILTGQRILLLEDGHCLREQALDLCGAAGAREMEFRATSLSTLTQMVVGGAGVTLLPELALAVESRGRDLGLRRFAEPIPYRTLTMAWRPNGVAVDPARALVSVARELLATGDLMPA